MASTVSSASRGLAVAAVLTLIAALAGCTPRPDGPQPAAEQFFAALATGDIAGASAHTDRPDQARVALSEAWAGLQAASLDAQILSARYAEDTGTIKYRYTWHLPKNRTWTYDGALNMVRDEGRWEVRWSATGLHPRLGENQTFALRAESPPRASVHERTGTNVLVPGFRYHFALDAKEAGAQLMTTARVVAETLHRFDNTLDPQRLAEVASSADGPLGLVMLRQADRDAVAGILAPLPGVVITPHPDMVPTDEDFAPAVINDVKNSVADQLDGEPGWRVVTVNQNGVDVDVLHEVAGAAAPSVRITLDRSVQTAAQNAVDTTGKQAMIVVLKPSTGEILAVAQNAAADRDGPVATMGLYPPGSTFKIITAAAAMERNMATPNTLLGCPGRMDIGHRTVPNYGGFDLGMVPMSRAFASSCNTTFAELASRMPPRGLTQAASQYGIGPDYKVAGLRTVTGSVPPTVNLTERTEDGFGQGKVVASPFGMALAAATVAAGQTPVPYLIDGRETEVSGTQQQQARPDVVDGLRPMMRLVVTNGTAKDLQGAGDVRGKTGEAEFAGGSHSWFTGYRGDMAFSALIVGGGSSEYAVRMLKGMLDALPPDYQA
ncbi:penicillin-binding transpeptidase domain-containing protein [Mycolicibacterium vaccae]|uniref:penicillin-binding transpeptidase domain-containing protein n=1 Tax=Mycolicibacterium vaccae TaxID=1810 RepID=UPI003D043908